MYFVFYQTSDVFAAEERLQNAGINVEVVPTPVQDKAYCGVCAQVNTTDRENALVQLKGMDYIVVE